MIDKRYGEYYGICDNCEEEAGPYNSWNQTREQMIEDGWWIYFDKKQDEWKHICSDCMRLKP